MSYSFERHTDDESLELYAFGRLGDARAELLEEHLLICEGCRTRLDTTQRYINAMARGSRILQRESAPDRFSQVAAWLASFRIPAPAWGAAADRGLRRSLRFHRQFAARRSGAPSSRRFVSGRTRHRANRPGESSAAPATRRARLESAAGCPHDARGCLREHTRGAHRAIRESREVSDGESSETWRLLCTHLETGFVRARQRVRARCSLAAVTSQNWRRCSRPMLKRAVSAIAITAMTPA